MPILPQNMTFTWKQRLAQILVIAVTLFLAVCLRFSSGRQEKNSEKMPDVRRGNVMGTTYEIQICRRNGHTDNSMLMEKAIRVLNHYEALCSTWIEASEISIFNRASASEKVPLSADVLEVMRLAKRAYEETDGVFNVTCGNVWQKWRRASETPNAQPPAYIELAAALKNSSWENIQLADTYAVKLHPEVQVVLGGIVKGIAVDRALEMLLTPDTEYASVNVGGDVATWIADGFRFFSEVEITSPEGGISEIKRITPEMSFIRHVKNGWTYAVCTSGNYARKFTVGGKEYSQILDPRTGYPTLGPAGVTVFASDSYTADIWSTALSVLGKDGVTLLPKSALALFNGNTSEGKGTHKK